MNSLNPFSFQIARPRPAPEPAELLVFLDHVLSFDELDDAIAAARAAELLNLLWTLDALVADEWTLTIRFFAPESKIQREDHDEVKDDERSKKTDRDEVKDDA